MSRTVSQTLLDAISNQQGETILRVKTWADLAAYDAAPTVPERTWETNKFKIEATEAEAHLVTDNDYTLSDFTVFIIERGVTLAGVEYVVQSGIYFVSSFIETDGRLKIKGSSFPDQKVIIDGDDTYENVITAFCTEIGKTATFKDTGAAWLDYQFLPAGKQVILNKAERFLNLIRQKYLILCYERGPKELVFYHATTEQSVWKDIIFADSQLVLAATSGASEMARSTDGLAYTKIQAPSFVNSTAYSPTLDLFAAVGNGVCITSPDGVTWTSRTIGTGNWTGITWDTTLAKFIAIRTGATASSANGITWQVSYQNTYSSTWSVRSNVSKQWISVCWSPELSLFVAVEYLNAPESVATSPDGITWTLRTPAEENTWNSVCWSAELSLFVAVSVDGTNRVMTSPNGITWTARAAASANQWYSVCWSPELSLFVAVGNTVAMTSPDGVNWTSRTPSSSNLWESVCWSPELTLFVAVSSNGTNRVMTSPDGINWTTRTMGLGWWTSVCWSPELSLFVAVSNGDTNYAMTSPDGVTWTARTSPNIGDSVCWSPELSLFVAVADADILTTSPDGITWTNQTITSGRWKSICWSPELSLLVSVAFGGATNFIVSNTPSKHSFNSINSSSDIVASVGVDTAYTSTDGAAWTSRTIPAGTYHKIIYANSLFVAVGASKCSTSPDGITWTERTIPAGTWLGLAYSSTLDLFVAVGDNLLCTSPDGITWTSRTAIADQAWQAVAWSDTLAAFYAVASDGDNRIASSEDGINWQILTTQADYSFSYLDGPTSSIIHGTNTVHFISRDETASVNTSGDTSFPAWNLGYLESTDSAPGTNSDPFYKFFLQKAPLRLDITDGDRVHFEPSWVLDPTQAIDAMIVIVEAFDSTKSPAWYQETRSLALFDSVEGGSLPSTIERVAAYTPLVSSGFDGNLTPEVNNLQALADAVDDLSIAAGPTTTAVNDFQVGDGLGAWVKKTLAETITILRTSLDSIYQALDGDLTAIAALSPSNDDIIQRKAGAWTNRTLAQLSTDLTELIQDIIGGMLTGNTETNITVTYQDTDGTIDFEVPTMREVLTAARTYYVRTDGNDSNDGLANTTGGAFLTIQKALDVAAALDSSIYDVTINVADGTYTENLVCKGLLGTGILYITGNTTTPANCVIAGGSSIALWIYGTKSRIEPAGFKTTGSSYGILAQGACIVILGNWNHATTGAAQIYVDAGANVTLNNNYTISAGAARHFWIFVGGYIQISSKTVTLSGTPAFSSTFVDCNLHGSITAYSVTFSGSATGKRYNATKNGVIDTNGGGANFFPGNSAGTTATGGQYI